MKEAKATGPDSITSEAIKANINMSTKLLHTLFSRAWKTEEVQADLREGHLMKLLKKGDLQEWEL